MLKSNLLYFIFILLSVFILSYYGTVTIGPRNIKYIVVDGKIYYAYTSIHFFLL